MNHSFFNMTWKISTNPCIGGVPGHQEEKAWKSKSNFKAMMIVFFNIRGIVHIDWVPEGQTVNQVYYKQVLTTFHERVKRRRPEMWKKSSWISSP
jgi:hypothetical protein